LTYYWDQRAFDHATARIDCRIHVRVGGRTMRDAFRYDWRQWSPPAMGEAMRDAGFAQADIWCDAMIDTPAGARGDGDYQPRRHIDAREDFVAYVVGVA